ncbi:MAG: NlpC/P60 family protein [Candidatus Shapirobacteria bacterium]
MVGTKLIELKEEIKHYIGLPYSKNLLKNGKIIKEKILGGKGSAKEIALKTIEIANDKNIKLLSLSPQEIYNFQKKNNIGIDCSGLVCQLLNFYLGTNLNPRKNSANMLTSKPLSKEIKATEIKTGDLARQKNGHHVLFIIEKNGNIIEYVDSSLSGRGVKYGQADLTDKNFIHQGFWRLLFLN